MSDQIEITRTSLRPIEVYKETWELIKPHFWILFSICLVGLMIGGASMYIVLGAMICGINYIFLQLIEGKDPEIETLFKGFSFFAPSLIVTIVMIVPAFIVFGALYVPILVASFSGQFISQEDLISYLLGVFVIESILAVMMVCFHTLLMFSFHLIIDKKLSALQAMKWSAKGVWANLSGVAGLWTLGILISIGGLLLFCVGTYLTIPIMLGANTVAYRKIFPGVFEGEV